eukprot:751307-Hanusia_phi.AAC.1
MSETPPPAAAHSPGFGSSASARFLRVPNPPGWFSMSVNTRKISRLHLNFPISFSSPAFQ